MLEISESKIGLLLSLKGQASAPRHEFYQFNDHTPFEIWLLTKRHIVAICFFS
jgi:hypothetical protein